jgi:hypothetical protein
MNWMTVAERFPIQLVKKPSISRRFVELSILMLGGVPSV